MKTFLIALALLAGTVAQASAADLGKGDKVESPFPDFSEAPRADWNGLYVDIGVGYSHGDLYSETIGLDGGLATRTPFVSGTIGFDAQMGALVIGAFGEASYLSPSALGTDLDDVGIDANYQLCGGLRAGAGFGRSLLYVGGAYCWVPVDVDGLGADIDLAGPAALAGFAHQFGDGFYIDSQGRYTWLEDDVNGFTINHDDLSFRVKIGKHF